MTPEIEAAVSEIRALIDHHGIEVLDELVMNDDVSQAWMFAIMDRVFDLGALMGAPLKEGGFDAAHPTIRLFTEFTLEEITEMVSLYDEYRSANDLL